MTAGVFNELDPGAYDFIMADPPWSFKTWSNNIKDRSRLVDSKYALMKLDDISKLPVRSLAKRDAVLWLWVTNPMLPDGLHVMEEWGFKYKTHGVWAKATKKGGQAFGGGYRLRSAHETFLIGTVGNPKTTKSVRSLFFDLRREHSRKPEMAYQNAVAMMPDAKRLDLFSRQRRDGWDSWGFEVDKFD